MNEILLPKCIRLMADYYCYPLWGDDGSYVGDIGPSDFPISEQLQKNLMKWARWFDSILNQNDPASSGFSSKEDRNSFIKEGERLLVCLKTELGDGFSVRLHEHSD